MPSVRAPWAETLVDYYSVASCRRTPCNWSTKGHLPGRSVRRARPEFGGGKESATCATRRATGRRICLSWSRSTNEDLDWPWMAEALAQLKPVGARHRPRVPHQHLRVSGRRGVHRVTVAPRRRPCARSPARSVPRCSSSGRPTAGRSTTGWRSSTGRARRRPIGEPSGDGGWSSTATTTRRACPARGWSRAAWRSAEIPRERARHGGGAGSRLRRPSRPGGCSRFDLLAEATRRSPGDRPDPARPSRFGLGFQLTQPERPLGPGGRAFGHFGAGGSLGFCDPDANLAFGYVINSMGPAVAEPPQRGADRGGVRFAGSVTFDKLVVEGFGVLVAGLELLLVAGRSARSDRRGATPG